MPQMGRDKPIGAGERNKAIGPGERDKAIGPGEKEQGYCTGRKADGSRARSCGGFCQLSYSGPTTLLYAGGAALGLSVMWLKQPWGCLAKA